METEGIHLNAKNKTRMENILLDQVLQQVRNREISIEKARELICVLFNVSKSEVFEHYGKPFTNGRDLWDFLTENYNFTKKI